MIYLLILSNNKTKVCFQHTLKWFVNIIKWQNEYVFPTYLEMIRYRSIFIVSPLIGLWPVGTHRRNKTKKKGCVSWYTILLVDFLSFFFILHYIRIVESRWWIEAKIRKEHTTYTYNKCYGNLNTRQYNTFLFLFVFYSFFLTYS